MNTSKSNRRRDTAIQAAIETLTKHAKGEQVDAMYVSRAAELLSHLRATDARSVSALVKNLGFQDSATFAGEFGPLTSLDAAEALRTIGGRAVAEALIDSLMVPRTRKEHLIIAHILASCDNPEVSAYRLRVAIERERVKDSPHLVHIRELEAVKHWLDTPGLLEERENWPSRM